MRFGMFYFYRYARFFAGFFFDAKNRYLSHPV